MSTERKSTMIELVDELRKLPQTDNIKFMIKEALTGEYHDYKNRKYNCGKIEAFTRLRELGHDELAARIASGEFDETMDAEDEAAMREDLAGSPGLAKALGLD